jgi:hypothetical protein
MDKLIPIADEDFLDTLTWSLQHQARPIRALLAASTSLQTCRFIAGVQLEHLRRPACLLMVGRWRITVITGSGHETYDMCGGYSIVSNFEAVRRLFGCSASIPTFRIGGDVDRTRRHSEVGLSSADKRRTFRSA